MCNLEYINFRYIILALYSFVILKFEFRVDAVEMLMCALEPVS